METFSALLAFFARNSPVAGEFPYKGQWRGALIISLIYAWTDNWANNGNAGDLRLYRAHYDVIVIESATWKCNYALQGKSPWLIDSHDWFLFDPWPLSKFIFIAKVDG